MNLSRLCRKGWRARLTPRVQLSFLGCVLVSPAVSACLGDDTSDIPDYEPDVEVLAFVEGAAARGIDVSHHLSSETRTLAAQLGLPLEATGGLAVADVDQDGHDDILFISGDDSSQLLLSDGNGSFDATDGAFALELDAYASGPLFADIDGDSDPDLLVANWLTGAVDVYENDGEAFVPMDPGDLALPGTPAIGLAAGDLDGDSDLDLFVARFGEGLPEGLLWVNDGRGHFEDHTAAVAEQIAEHLGADAWGLGSPLFYDLDRAGYLDILLTSMPGPSLVLRNDTIDVGSLTFKLQENAADATLSGTLGDLNNDGHADWLLSGTHADLTLSSKTDAGSDAGEVETSMDDGGLAPDAGASLDASTRAQPTAGLDYDWRVADNTLLLNTREGAFETWPTEPNIDVEGGPASCIADFNNDGLPDIFQASSQLGKSNRMRLFLQLRDGSGRFLDAAEEVGLERNDDGRAAVCFDYDRDGDVDIFVFNHEGKARLYRNTLDPGTGPAFFFGLRLEGSDEKPNVIGARISIVAGQTVQTRELGSTSGHLAQSAAQAHFGLSAVESIQQLRIAWPDGAEDTLLEDVPINEVLTVTRR